MEQRLRDERPQPSERLVRSIVAGVAPRRSRHARPLTLGKIAATAAVAVGLFAIGGLGFAATSFTNNGLGGFVHHLLRGNNAHVRTIYRGAADAQYSTTSSTPTTTSGATTNEETGAITFQATLGGETFRLSYKGGIITFSTFGLFSGSIQVTATPIQAETIVGYDRVRHFFGAFNGNTQAIDLAAIFTVANGGASKRTTSGRVPGGLEVTMKDVSKRFVPMFSVHGKNWQFIPLLKGTTLPKGMEYGYYLKDGYAHILTRKSGIFGTLNRANADISETGHKLAGAGSHRWGDPELIKPGAPKLRVTKGARVHNGNRVSFRLYTNEQVKATFSIVSHGKNIPISGKESFFRGHRIGGRDSHTIRRRVLHRLGSMTVSLSTVKPLPPGATVRATFTDVDGNKVTTTLGIKK